MNISQANKNSRMPITKVAYAPNTQDNHDFPLKTETDIAAHKIACPPFETLREPFLGLMPNEVPSTFQQVGYFSSDASSKYTFSSSPSPLLRFSAFHSISSKLPPAKSTPIVNYFDVTHFALPQSLPINTAFGPYYAWPCNYPVFANSAILDLCTSPVHVALEPSIYTPENYPKVSTTQAQNSTEQYIAEKDTPIADKNEENSKPAGDPSNHENDIEKDYIEDKPLEVATKDLTLKRRRPCFEEEKEELKDSFKEKESNQRKAKKIACKHLLTHQRRALQSENSTCKELIIGQAYEARNVYKSIIRHMHTYVKRNKERLKGILRKAGYTDAEMQSAFETIGKYKNPTRPKEIEKNSQIKIEMILKSKSILTHVLREVLVFMLEKWRKGRYGQLSTKNSTIYRESCNKFLKRVEELLI